MMAFSFGFSGDDIEEDPTDISSAQQNTQITGDGGNGPPPIEARTHDVDEMVSRISLSFSSLTLLFM
jgi:protein-histidine N-methyltransferase